MRIRIGMLIALIFLVGCDPDDYVSNEVQSYAPSSPTFQDVDPTPYVETLDPQEYVVQLLSGVNVGVDLRLPGYSYFQGVIQANNHVVIAGQVRVVGGVIGVDAPDATLNLYNGAMITSNPHSFLGAEDGLVGGPAGMYTRIRTLQEIPNP